MIRVAFLSIAFLSFFSLKAQRTSGVEKIIFSTGSRGYQKTITLTKDSILIATAGGEKPGVDARKMDTTAWAALQRTLADVSVEELNALLSPTHARQSDAARHSSLSVALYKTTYSHSFDNENPNEKLKPLLDEILKIIKN